MIPSDEMIERGLDAAYAKRPLPHPTPHHHRHEIRVDRLRGGDTVTDLRELSVAWEKKMGYDSIPTIERVYHRRASGAYECIWPGCTFARHDPEVLWRHVHSAHTDAHDKLGLPPVDWDPR